MTKERIYKSKHLTSLVFPKYFVLKNQFKINFFPLDFVNMKKKTRKFIVNDSNPFFFWFPC